MNMTLRGLSRLFLTVLLHQWVESDVEVVASSLATAETGS